MADGIIGETLQEKMPELNWTVAFKRAATAGRVPTVVFAL